MPFSTSSAESYFASTSTHTEVPPTSAVRHTTSAAPEIRAMPNPTDNQFRYSFNVAWSSRTHESRHDAHWQSMSDVPPPYAEETATPLLKYTLHAPDPLTLAMDLFMFGFHASPYLLLSIPLPNQETNEYIPPRPPQNSPIPPPPVSPPFWIVGALFLLWPLREPPVMEDSTPAWMPRPPGRAQGDHRDCCVHNNGFHTFIGYDSVICLELYESWVLEIYNSSVGLPSSMRIVDKVAEIKDMKSK